MATKIPLVLGTDGRAQQLQAGDSLAGGGGGGASDMLSALTSAEVAVTTTATLTLGKMHVCSGTSANYTVTLPAASGNAGKFVGVRMASGLTKLVTVAGNGAELINGLNTRIMWANEAAVLECDGTSWFKVGGKSCPIGCKLSGVPNFFASTSGTETTIGAWQTAAWDDVSGWNGANSYTIPRPGRYRVDLALLWNYDGNGYGRQIAVYAGSDSVISYTKTGDPPARTAQVASVVSSRAAGDTCYGTATATYGTLYVDTAATNLTVQELNPW